jgi:hypothetical protein
MSLPDILNEDILTPEQIQLKMDIRQLYYKINSLRRHLDLLHRLRGRPYFNLEHLITNTEATLQRNINEFYRLKTAHPYLGKRMSKGRKHKSKRQ